MTGLSLHSTETGLAVCPYLRGRDRGGILFVLAMAPAVTGCLPTQGNPQPDETSNDRRDHRHVKSSVRNFPFVPWGQWT
jgi:hypothetical protein